jgi:hypothetical protein
MFRGARQAYLIKWAHADVQNLEGWMALAKSDKTTRFRVLSSWAGTHYRGIGYDPSGIATYSQWAPNSASAPLCMFTESPTFKPQVRLPPRCISHDCQRHGTTTLFAALNALDGTVIGRNMQRHRLDCYRTVSIPAPMRPPKRSYTPFRLSLAEQVTCPSVRTCAAARFSPLRAHHFVRRSNFCLPD